MSTWKTVDAEKPLPARTQEEPLMKKYIAPFVVVAAAAVFFAVSYRLTVSSRDAGTPPEIVTKRLHTAGRVVWYTSTPLAHAERIANAFRLDSGIDVEVVRDSTFRMKDRLLEEIAGGVAAADVVTIADTGTYVDLQRAGRLMEYDCPHYRHYSEEFRNEPYWAVFAAFGICMAYDENRTAAPPAEWTDLLHPRWRGRIGIESIEEAGSQYGQYYALRKELGPGFWRKLLGGQEPKIYHSTAALASALLEGEIDVAGQFSIYTVYSFRQGKGTSIRGVYPGQGIPLVLTPTAILDSAPNPDGAKVFTDFLLSKTGQELMQRLAFKYSLRDDVAPLGGKPALQTLNILLPEAPKDFSTKRASYIKEFRGFLADGDTAGK